MKAAESESRLRELTTREKQSEHDLLGLRDTIAAHKLEINTLRKEKEELARINQDLQEDVNVKGEEREGRILAEDWGFARHQY